jgi:hypothetical protein
MPQTHKKQAEWFRLFLDSLCIDMHFPAELDIEMRSLSVARHEVLSVIEGCKIVECDYPEAGVVSMTLEGEDCNDELLFVTIRVFNDMLRIDVVGVVRPDGD